MQTRARILTIALAALFLGACGDDNGTTPKKDTGPQADTMQQDMGQADLSQDDMIADDMFQQQDMPPQQDMAQDDQAVGDTQAGDMRDDVTVADTSTGDTAVGDTTVGDTTVGDTATGDTATGDTAVGDTAVGDTATGDATVAFGSQLYIWEVDSDTPTGPPNDAAEFIEVWNNTGASINFSTDKYFMVFINGSNDRSYLAVQLTGTLANGAIVTVGSPGVSAADIKLANTNMIQNGADGIILVKCNACTDAATDFPNNTDPGTGTTFTTADGKTATKIDAIAYDNGQADDSNLMSKCGVSTQWNEDANGNGDTESNQRVSPTTWTAQTATPGVK
jgi:hypothetical protein